MLKSKFAIATLVLTFASSSFAAEWNYDEADLVHGPSAWGDLEGAEACGNGLAQSPIDLGAHSRGENPRLNINYKYTSLNVVNNGHTIQVNVANGSTLTINGKTFELLQFHFHSPSEHVVSGHEYPMEVHFVNKAADGKLAVIGVFIREGYHNRTLQKIWDIAPKEATTEIAHSDEIISPVRLLGDEEEEYYGYQGSLTTPPCSEIVTWNVLKDKIEASAEQIAYFKSLIHEGHNARPVQAVNGRSVTLSHD
ncbi:MAG: carbonic anhydrase family protein [Gammaproteobacteria bacterium]|nr:carbonic anhydrase family protein [Gammaproteobacteria bacterium]